MSHSMITLCQCPCPPGGVDLTCWIHTRAEKRTATAKGKEHSRQSSIITFGSPFTVPSSATSSLTLVERGHTGEYPASLSPPAYDKLPRVPSSHEGSLVPYPLRIQSCEDWSPPRPRALSPAQWLDKPLPPLPSATTSPVHQVQGLGIFLEEDLDGCDGPESAQGKHYALPNMPLPRHQRVLDRAFARAGYSNLPSGRLQDQPERCDSQNQHVSISPGHKPAEHIPPWPTSQPLEYVPRERYYQKSKHVSFTPTRIDTNQPDAEASPPTLNRPRRHTLTRVLQRLWPSESLRRLGSRSFRASAPAMPQSLASAVPDISPRRSRTQSLPSSGRSRPLSAATRVQRVLSILVDGRISLDLSNVAATADIDELLQQTRHFLIDGLQPLTTRASDSDNCPGTSAHPKPERSELPLSFPRSMYELGAESLVSLQDPTTTSAFASVMRYVMEEVDDLQDLFSLALVNRTAYTTFKADELGLIKSTLRKTSPPAWELRQVSEVDWDTEGLDGGQSLATSLYLRHYARDICSLAATKLLLLDHCEPLLSDDMVTGLRNPYHPRAGEVDAAIWRVWTFCCLFGSRKEREDDIAGQDLWLRGEGTGDFSHVCQTAPDPADFNTVLFTPPDGFAQGNDGGLRKKQLLDMVEVWIALGSLLDFLRRETRRARRNGIFAAVDPPPANSREEVHVLKAWLDFILTLGPAAVLEMAPQGPNTDPDYAFKRAAANGWTHWVPPPPKAVRRNFLLGAVRSRLRVVDVDGSDNKM